MEMWCKYVMIVVLLSCLGRKCCHLNASGGGSPSSQTSLSAGLYCPWGLCEWAFPAFPHSAHPGTKEVCLLVLHINYRVSLRVGPPCPWTAFLSSMLVRTGFYQISMRNADMWRINERSKDPFLPPEHSDCSSAFQPLSTDGGIKSHVAQKLLMVHGHYEFEVRDGL